MAKEEIVVEKTKKELYEEAKARRLADKEKKAKKEAKKAAKEYRNPINSLAGKIIIWFLCLSMVATIIFSFIYLLIKNI